MQTEESFDPAGCEGMLQMLVFIFALILNNEKLKEEFIEQIMDLEEECQEALARVIQDADGLIENL